MRRWRLGIGAGLAAVTVWSAACSTASESPTTTIVAGPVPTETTAPASSSTVPTRATTEPGSEDEVAAPETPGAAVYAASCAECHGDDLRGSDEGPSLLSIVYEPNHHSDAAIALAVLRGSPAHHWDFGPMEPVEGLDDADIEAVIRHIRDQQSIHGFESYPP